MRVKLSLLLLAAVFCLAATARAEYKGNIVFVSYQVDTKIDPATNDYPDMPHILALEDAGYQVTIFYNASLSTAEQATLDTLYNADLIVMGRSTPSPGYGDHKQAWNDIPTPILNLELWNCRSSRLNWFNTTTMVSLGDENVIHNAIIEVPDDPVFEGLDTSAPVPWVIGSMDAVGAKNAGNGKVLARMENDSTVLFVRFEPNVEFYDGAGDMPGGPRTVIGNGRDVSGGPPFNYYNFTPESEQVFLAEVARMVELGKSSAVKNRKPGSTPSMFALFQNYPNPFNPTTTIRFRLPERTTVRLTLSDLLGKEVMEIANGEFNAGHHEVLLNAGHLPAGVYFYKIVTATHTAMKKLALVK